jgi:hypothetical protein
MGQPLLPSGDAAEIVFGPESKREGRQIPMSVFPANCDDVYQWKLARRDTACFCERRNDGPDVRSSYGMVRIEFLQSCILL